MQRLTKPFNTTIDVNFIFIFVIILFLILILSLSSGVNDVDEVFLERGSADEESVDVGFRAEFLAVGRRHGSPVDDTSCAPDH